MGNSHSSTSSLLAATVTVAGPTVTATVSVIASPLLTTSSRVVAATPSSSIIVQVTTTPSPTPTPTRPPLAPAAASVGPAAVFTVQASTILSTQGAAAVNPASETATPVSRPTVGPFEPEFAILGGIPNKDVDQPMTAVFLVLFLMGAATHFTLHEVNGKRGHKFHLSDAVFDFCMVRTVTCVMRIVWVNRTSNQSVVVAALIFENAGVVVLFLVNAFFVQRITRAVHPKFGWNPLTTIFFRIVIFSIPFIIVWNIISLVGGFFTLDAKKLLIVRGFTIFGAVWTTLLSVFPAVFLAGVFAAPKSGPPDNFGTGRLLTKVIMVVSASVILFVGAIIRINSVINPRPKADPGVLNGKAVFYITGFLFEILVVIGYAAFRIDLRFHVPDGCHGPGDYTGKRRLSTESTTDLTGTAAEINEMDVNKLVEDFAEDEKLADDFAEDKKFEPITPVAKRWTGKPTESQVEAGLAELGLHHKIFGQTVEVGDSKLLFYVFEAQQDDKPTALGMDGVMRGAGISMRNSEYSKRASGFYGSRPPPRQSAYGGRASVRRMSNLYMM